MTARTRARISLLTVIASLGLAALACWSSDTLFIPPTATPTPTQAPPTSAGESLYRVGDTLRIVGEGIAPVYLTQRPEPVTRRNRVANAACYPNTTVVVTAVERVEDVTYYEVACNNTPGWVAESSLGLP